MDTGGPISENIDPEYFEDDSLHAPGISSFDDYLEPVEDGVRTDAHSHRGIPVGKEHPSSNVDDLNENEGESFVRQRENDLQWIFDSFQAGTYLTPVERSTGMTMRFADRGPNLLIHRSTAKITTRHAWRKKVASMRSLRLPVVVMQILIRRQILKTGEDRDLLDLLPKGEQRRTLIDLVASTGYSRQDIDNMMYVIEGKSDQERCERFLQVKGYKPIWLLHFIIRPDAKVSSVSVLVDILSYCEEFYDGRRKWEKQDMWYWTGTRRSKMKMLSMAPKIFRHTIKYLAMQCMVVDGRLLIKVAELAAQYIKNMGKWDHHPDRIYYYQCELFNHTLEVLTPSLKPLPPTWYRPLPCYWQAQKILLSMSASLDRQLQVNKAGFTAVREVLAGLDKNQTEIHNSDRHAPNWPPYLEIRDGIDEMVDPEDNWSRSVSAGALQQEAGFDLDKRDQSLDILQGKAPDGTPTVQQRIIRKIHRDTGPWESTIMATRNAEEAWARFSDPPEPGLRPGVYEYRAMFTKLCLRDVDPAMGLRPGDRAFNFEVKQDPNLSEFAKSRMQPPSVEELYAQMRRAGIRPSGGCLDVLVANAKSLERAHQYLRDSTEIAWPLMMSRFRGENAKALMQTRKPLVAAYIKVISHIESKPGRELLRAIRLCEKRFEHDQSGHAWPSYVWGIILKAFSAKSRSMRRFGKDLTEQLRAYHLVVEKIEDTSPIRLPALVQFGKCLRKAAARALAEHLHDLTLYSRAADSPLRFMYDMEARQPLAKPMHGSGVQKSWLRFFGLGTKRMKNMIQGVIDREAVINNVFSANRMVTLERMSTRGDPVRATDAYEVMETWAFLGEFEEMASLLEWLVKQWDNTDLLEELQEYEEIPGRADFHDTLCLFRKYAEPMLSEERVEDLRQSISKAQVVWTWPDDEMVAAFYDAQHEAPYLHLEHVLEWTRYRQALDRGEDPATLRRPPKWRDQSWESKAGGYSRRSEPW